jgi:hypothetical protein
LGNPKERDYLQDLGAGGRLIIKLAFKKESKRAWTEECSVESERVTERSLILLQKYCSITVLIVKYFRSKVFNLKENMEGTSADGMQQEY